MYLWYKGGFNGLAEPVAPIVIRLVLTLFIYKTTLLLAGYLHSQFTTMCGVGILLHIDRRADGIGIRQGL